jgi:hypothetical protein
MTWIKKKFEGDPVAAVKTILASHSTGKLILDFSQGTVLNVEWREKASQSHILVDRVPEKGAILSP